MPKPGTLHPYSDLSAFERLMLLIATFIHYPGVGCPDRMGAKDDRESLAIVREKIGEVAQQFNISLANYSIPTLRKDLVTLRKYGILDPNIYRWGYFLGTGVMTVPELQVAMNALSSMAKYQRSPQAMRIYRELEKKLRNKQGLSTEDFLYPIRIQMDRAIVYTDPEEMFERQQTRHNLFHHLDTIEAAIAAGQALQLYRHIDPYAGQVGHLQVFPLQLVYHDIAWYLLYEYLEDGHLEIERIDRFSDRIESLHSSRGIDRQRQSLEVAHSLFEKGWGLYLGDRSEQQQERAGDLPLIQATVRFFPPAIAFIEEGEKRHHSQQIDSKGKPHYIDYSVKLPPRSLNEFSHWVHRFANNAQMRKPSELVDRFRQAVRAQMQLYE